MQTFELTYVLKSGLNRLGKQAINAIFVFYKIEGPINV